MGRVGALASIVLNPLRFPVYEIALCAALALAIVLNGRSVFFISAAGRSSVDLAFVNASVINSFPAFIAFVLSVVYAWNFASSVSHGEALTILSMPVSRRLIASLAAVGCVAMPIALLATCTAITTYIYANEPTAKLIVATTLAMIAIPTIVSSMIFVSAIITRNKWVSLATGLASSIGLGIAGTLAVAFNMHSKLSQAEAIAISCLSPIGGALNFHRFAGMSVLDLAIVSSVIDLVIAIAICLLTIYMVDKRWEPT